MGSIFDCAKEPEVIVRKNFDLQFNPTKKTWSFEYEGVDLTYPANLTGRFQIILSFKVDLLSNSKIKFSVILPPTIDQYRGTDSRDEINGSDDDIEILNESFVKKQETKSLLSGSGNGNGKREYKKTLDPNSDYYSPQNRTLEIKPHYEIIEKHFDNDVKKFMAWCGLHTIVPQDITKVKDEEGVYVKKNKLKIKEMFEEYKKSYQNSLATYDNFKIDLNRYRFNHIAFCDLNKLQFRVEPVNAEYKIAVKVEYIDFDNSKLKDEIGNVPMTVLS